MPSVRPCPRSERRRGARASWRLACASVWAAALALGACGGGAGEADPAAQAEPGVTEVALTGPLDAGNMALVSRALRSARANGDDVLLLAIDTPGGDIGRMVDLAQLVRDAGAEGLLTVAWVRGGATSAGALVTLACERIYMTSTATMGSATVVTMGPTGIQDLPEEGGVREKIGSHVRAKFRGFAEAQGRSPELAQAMVDAELEVRLVREGGVERYMTGAEWDDRTQRGAQPELVRTVVPRGRLLNLTGPEAVALGMADGVVDDHADLLARIGKRGATVAKLERSRGDELLSLLTTFAPMLLLAALWLGYMELKTPGFGLPGILSILCFAVVLGGRYMVGLADAPHLVLVFIGLALIVVELFVIPGTLWVGIVGGLLVFGGLVASELGPAFELGSAADRRHLLDVAFRLGATAVVGLIGAWMMSRFLPDTPVLKHLVQQPATVGPPFAEAMPEARDEHARVARVGAVGVATTALRPVGKVVLDEAPELSFEARAAGESIDAGARVEVVAARAGRLEVEPRRGEGGEGAA